MKPSVALELGISKIPEKPSKNLDQKELTVQDILSKGDFMLEFVEFIKAEKAFYLLQFCFMADSYKRLATFTSENSCIEKSRLRDEAKHIYKLFFDANAPQKIYLSCLELEKITADQILESPSAYVFDGLLACVFGLLNQEYLPKFREMYKIRNLHYKISMNSSDSEIDSCREAIVFLSDKLSDVENKMIKCTNQEVYDDFNLTYQGIYSQMEILIKLMETKIEEKIVEKDVVKDSPRHRYLKRLQQTFARPFELLKKPKKFHNLMYQSGLRKRSVVSLESIQVDLPKMDSDATLNQSFSEVNDIQPDAIENQNVVEKQSDMNISMAELDTILDCAFGAIEEIFFLGKIKNWFRNQELNLIKIVLRNLYGKEISDSIENQVTTRMSDENIGLYLDSLKDSLMPLEEIAERNLNEKERARQDAKAMLLEFTNESPLGRELEKLQVAIGRYNTLLGLTRLFSMLQNQELNELLIFKFIEIIIQFISTQ
jgi:hypothetical protein